jgi:exo-beta-1,3-glucanase (GH17 family)
MSDTSPPASDKPVFPHGNAICYSGYRQDQSPRTGDYPSHREVTEDLMILAEHWDYLRLYDSSRHAEIVLDVIERESLDFKVMLGVDLAAELSNPECPWGADFTETTLEANRADNDGQVERAIALANRYPNTVFSVAVGNEAAVEWTDHLVPVERLIAHVRAVKRAVHQPVTSCDNYVPWTNTLEPLAAELDFISVHTYPAWEQRTMADALEFTQENYRSVVDHYPGRLVVITEAGWPTASNGRGIEPANASEAVQAQYYNDLMQWTTEAGILTFVFEAFDEPWKGSPHPHEPEKHWGLFTLDRTPKLVMQDRYAGLLRS